MRVRYLGHACFEITTKQGLKVITDPYTKVGYELPKGLTADIVTVSHGHFDHCFTQAIATRHVLSETGVCSIEGVDFNGISSFHDPEEGALRGKNIIYKMSVDGVTLCHMGDIGEECCERIAKEIGEVDVLFIPIGGTYTIDAVGATKYINRLQPKVVIPMHFKPADGVLNITDINSFTNLYPTNAIQFLKEGVLDLEEGTRGIFYMERVKGV